MSKDQESQSPAILTEVSEGIGTLTLNRPDTLNAMTPAFMAEMRTALADLAGNGEVRVIVITGTGRGFSSGGDKDFLEDITRMTPFQIKSAVYENFQGAVKAVKLCPKPTIAAVNGPAAGAGCELAIACDFRIAAESAFFMESWVHLGIIAPLGGMLLLPRLIGLGRAQEMLMLGKRVEAAEALRIGLVSDVVPDRQLAEEARDLARQLAAGPALAYTAFKEGIRRGMESTLNAEWEYGVNMQAMLLNSGDFAEAVAALREKRKPVFKGT